jgi:hypothetical protein
VRGGCNKAVKTLTGSWEDGEDPSEALRSCGGTKADRFGWEKFGAENHYRTENGVIARGGMQLEGAE